MILPNSAAYTKARDLWYEDGNVILEAEDTLFRVPTLLLANTSRVFRELFSLADAPDAETFECCPLIHLTDRATDVAYFIKALLDPSFFEPDNVTDFFVLAGVLRLSTKYFVSHLRAQAVQLLSLCYPSDLEAFEASIPPRPPLTRIKPFQGRVFAAVNLARECNVPAILPTAFFICCTGMNVIELTDGVVREGKKLELEWKDKRLCIIGRAMLETRTRTCVMGFLLGTTKARRALASASAPAPAANRASVATNGSTSPPSSSSHSRTHSSSTTSLEDTTVLPPPYTESVMPPPLPPRSRHSTTPSSSAPRLPPRPSPSPTPSSPRSSTLPLPPLPSSSSDSRTSPGRASSSSLSLPSPPARVPSPSLLPPIPFASTPTPPRAIPRSPSPLPGPSTSPTNATSTSPTHTRPSASPTQPNRPPPASPSTRICVSPLTCNATRLRFLADIEARSAACGRFNPLLTGFSWEAFRKRVCTMCYDESVRSWRDERARLWADLGGIFEVNGQAGETVWGQEGVDGWTGEVMDGKDGKFAERWEDEKSWEG